MGGALGSMSRSRLCIDRMLTWTKVIAPGASRTIPIRQSLPEEPLRSRETNPLNLHRRCRISTIVFPDLETWREFLAWNGCERQMRVDSNVFGAVTNSR